MEPDEPKLPRIDMNYKAALTAMTRGSVLTLSHTDQGDLYQIEPGGHHLYGVTGRALSERPDVISNHDSLLPGEPPQSWRMPQHIIEQFKLIDAEKIPKRASRKPRRAA
jgi:hypothetical protein